MKRTLFILAFSFFSFILKSQSIRIMPDDLGKETIYLVDNLTLTNDQIQLLSFEKKELKKVYIKNSKIIVKTKLPIVLNDNLLITKEEKEKKLSGIKNNEITNIFKLDKSEAKNKYGRKAKRGVIIVETK